LIYDFRFTILEFMQTQIKYRTKQLALNVINLVDDLPNKPSVSVISRKIVEKKQKSKIVNPKS